MRLDWDHLEVRLSACGYSQWERGVHCSITRPRSFVGDNDIWMQYTLQPEDYVGQNTIFMSKQIAGDGGQCDLLAVLRLTAHHPVIEEVEHVMCENTTWDTLGQIF